MKPRSIRIAEPCGVRVWRVVHRRLKKHWGLCDHDERVLEVHTPLTIREQVSVLVHEATHAAVPDLAERAVCRIERSVMQAIMPYINAEDDE